MSLSFTEDSLVIAETERDVVMGSTTIQITEVMEGKVEIVVH